MTVKDPPRLTIKLVRHGESLANTGHLRPQDVGDPNIALSERGREQARRAGLGLGAAYLSGACLYCSPYRRTRETLGEILSSADLDGAARVYEDPRLREVERGYADEASQHELRQLHGWFYYRHLGGESPADCFDRTSSFIESMMRSVTRHDTRKVLIVTHGMTIRCFVMRFLHLSVEQFESMANPDNCDVVTLASRESIADPVFENGRWAVSGLRLR